MKDDAPQILTSRGIRFPHDPAVPLGRSAAALKQDRYEARESEAALRIVRKGDVVLELGGGIGYMSTLLATHRAPTQIHVFEANPALVPYIRRVHAENGVTNATVHHAILGAEAGTADFHVRRNFLASSLAPVEGTEVLETVQIEQRAAAAVMAELAPNVLICDIEGAEAELLPLMDLSGLRAAIIELHPQWIGPAGVNAVFTAMIQAGLAYHARTSTNKVVCFRRDWPLK
jgi:FkbM family methyltransferase